MNNMAALILPRVSNMKPRKPLFALCIALLLAGALVDAGQPAAVPGNGVEY